MLGPGKHTQWGTHITPAQTGGQTNKTTERGKRKRICLPSAVVTEVREFFLFEEQI